MRGEMARRCVTYAQVVDRLRQIGVDESERNLRNEASRGHLPQGFLLQCLTAVGVETLHLG
ncbi:DUF6471 domain-containing protein [Jiella pelagia]|uniref:DUF6471 domain-containing protein n=1 Tax=Jiella pelagia TaxID=2986949 RepID=UPI0038B31733